jgi:acyl-coenzyme A synthetase/AMP-(fatty) acid ligase
LQATPTQFSLIGEHIYPNENMTILVGGEAITPKLTDILLLITKDLYNVYGPSETTIWSTCKKIHTSSDITIGKPISNTQCIILDNNHQPSPQGSIGELCIGGMGVSVGYLNRSDLTNTKFITIENSKFYKTGDLVRMNENTELEYIGRTDFQIKINGHRIELEEIINVMEQHNSVKRATVTTKENNGNIFIVAYYIGINENNIIDHMRSKLPHYMVPNFTIWLPRFPETLNGKINMNQLPNPFNSNDSNIVFVNSGEMVEPRNELEQKLYDIFMDIIGCHTTISVTESIYNYGMTSVMIPRLIYQINKLFKKELTIQQFIENSTVSMCAKLLSH